MIVGPTASGKSETAMGVARLIGGAEIVALDSMQVYRGMDIGTATPTAAEQAEVPHHLIDLVEVSEEFAVAEFQASALAVIGDIRSRGAVPVLVGGTGLYVRAVIDDLNMPGRYPEARRELEAEPDTVALHRRLADLDPVAAARMAPSNRRRIVRALEVTLGSGRPFSSYGPGLDHYPSTPFVQVGLRWDRDRLDARIAARYRRQMDDGFLDEVRSLAERPVSRTAVPGPRLQGVAHPPARGGDPRRGPGPGGGPHTPFRPPPGALVPPRPPHSLARRPRHPRRCAVRLARLCSNPASAAAPRTAVTRRISTVAEGLDLQTDYKKLVCFAEML